jgi:hypothetical protein
VLVFQVMYRDFGPGEVRTDRPKLAAWHYWLYGASVLCALVALIGFGVVRRPGDKAKFEIGTSVASANAAPRFRNASMESRFAQPRLYPYSVVPGGVESAQELRNAIANDPLVARLYANCDLSRTHVVRLTKSQEMYVSYRMDGKIYWTKKPLLLLAGEMVLTDGNCEARTRCGNRVSESPMQPVAPKEPPIAALNAQPTSALVAQNSQLPLLPPPGSPSLDPGMSQISTVVGPPPEPPFTYIPPPIFPIVGGGPPSFPNIIPPPSPVATPEPGALSLLVLGLLTFAATVGLARIRRRWNA